MIVFVGDVQIPIVNELLKRLVQRVVIGIAAELLRKAAYRVLSIGHDQQPSAERRQFVRTGLDFLASARAFQQNGVVVDHGCC